MEHKYMYVIVRNDLSPAQRAVQASHAAIESTRKYLSDGDEHPSVIILIVKNERKLIEVQARLKYDHDIEHIVFEEPDIGNQMTALATTPLCGDDRDIFKRFQLLT